MAGLRNLAIGAIHLAGRRDITEATAGPPAPCTDHPDSQTSTMINNLGTAVPVDLVRHTA